MITDEELREIAKELRIHSNCEGFKDCTECQELSVKLFGDRFVLCQLDSQDVSYWGAVADLIDRPTCHLVLTDVETHGNAKVRIYECSECGRTCEEIYGKYERCPHCGAVVVDDN